MPTLAAVVLAAGKSTRMKSRTVKVLHPIAGVPMIGYALSALAAVNPARTVLVVGYGGADVEAAVGDGPLFVEQAEQLGTGHALLQAQDALAGQADLVLSIYGDMPLLRGETLRRLVEVQQASSAALTLLTVSGEDSMGFGRIVRDAEGRVQAIVEEKVATPEQLAVQEYNAGVYCFDATWLWPRLAALPRGPIGEYYLTDMIAVAVADGRQVETVACPDRTEACGINNRVQLAQAEAVVRERIRRQLMLDGVTLMDPATTYIDAGVTIAADTTILPNTLIEGKSIIGANCTIGPNSHIINTTIGEGCRVWASVLEDATVEDDASIGPFSHLRPGAHLGRHTHLGNFGEVKNSTLGEHVHMGHFSYIGDATVGDHANIGAGTITCNFDGVQKNHTDIGEHAFVGSDTMLVAPVKVGRRARTGAGSVVTRDVPDDSLAYGVPARVSKKAEEKE